VKVCTKSYSGNLKEIRPLGGMSVAGTVMHAVLR
jgi:hypothetical protein